MKRFRLALCQVMLVGGLLLGVSTAGAVGSAIPVSTAQTTLRSLSQVQQVLAEGAIEQKRTITFKYKGNMEQFASKIDQTVHAALAKDTYIYYILDHYKVKWQGGYSYASVTVTFTYRESAGQTKEVKKRTQAVLNKIIKPGMTSDQKVKVIHDWVVTNLKYDLTLSKYTAYKGLATGKAVCQGYALLTYRMLQEAGIPVTIVEGTAGNQLHAWNLVKLGNKWYHLDTTWDDPVPDRAGKVSYNYYLLTDQQMRKDHTWTKKYPAANTVYRKQLASLKVSNPSRALVYRQLEKQLGYDLYQDDQLVTNSAELKSKVSQAINAGGHSVTVRYRGTEAELDEDMKILFELDIDNITYIMENLPDTKDSKVRIEWE